MFHRKGFSWLTIVARRPRNIVPHPHPGYEPEPSEYELAPACFIVRAGFFMACNRLCNPQKFSPRKNVPHPHPGYEHEPSGYELAYTCFIVRVFHGLQSSHAGHEKMSHTHTRDMNQNLRDMNWPLHVSS